MQGLVVLNGLENGVKLMNVGDKIFYSTHSYSQRIGTKLVESVVTKIGRQYIYIGENHNIKVDKKMLKGETAYGYIVEAFLTKQDWEDKKEKEILWYKIKDYFSISTRKNSLKVETLREVAKLIGVANG